MESNSDNERRVESAEVDKHVRKICKVLAVKTTAATSKKKCARRSAAEKESRLTPAQEERLIKFMDPYKKDSKPVPWRTLPQSMKALGLRRIRTIGDALYKQRHEDIARAVSFRRSATESLSIIGSRAKIADQVKSALDNATESLSTMEERMATLRAASASNEAAMEMAKAEAEKLSSQVKSAKSIADSSGKTVDALRSELAKTNAQLVHAGAIDVRLSHLESVRRKQEAEMRALVGNIDAAKSEIARMREAEAQQAFRVASLTKENAGIQKGLNIVGNELFEAVQQRDALARTIDFCCKCDSQIKLAAVRMSAHFHKNYRLKKFTGNVSLPSYHMFVLQTHNMMLTR